jgi:hypothetical protein
LGAAVLAAGAVSYRGVWEATAAMIRVERTFTPRAERKAAADDLFGRFRDELKRRGYL